MSCLFTVRGVFESRRVLVACRVLSLRPARITVQKAYLITRSGPSLHSDPARTRPVSTRSTFADAGPIAQQPAVGMVAGGRVPDPVQKENESPS